MRRDVAAGDSAEVVLAPRPRRFGKTLNLSMVRYFLEKSPEDLRALFAGLVVESSAVAWAHFQRYPVIFMTFKDVKPTSWENCLAGMAEILAGVFGDHRDVLEEGALASDEAEVFEAILHRRASRAQLTGALRLLSRLLAQHHREKVVILIDEYDSPIHAGYTNRYYDEVIAFFRDFLSGGLKDNADLFKGVLTGILRVARESLFSGLDNIAVHGILRPQLAPYFGFTEPEVRGLVEAVGQPELLDGIRAFYNGYVFGGQAIYNPWSVLSFLDSPDKAYLPYWIKTSSNELVRELLLTGPQGVRADLEALLAGGTIDKPIEESIALREVSADPDAVWSFLLFTGYLKAVEVRILDEGDTEARLSIPNREVAGAIRKMVRTWIAAQVGGFEKLRSLLDALLHGDAPVVERHLAQMAGLLTALSPRFDVRSNRESGYGRCDVMVLPRAAGPPGVVLELKRVDTEAGESKEKALAAALRQIRKRDYAAELRARGAAPIHEMAAVFDGKRVHVRAAAAPKKKKPSKPKAKARAKRAR